MGLVRTPRGLPRLSGLSRRSVAGWVVLTVVLGLACTAVGTLAARGAERAAVEQQLSRRAELAGAEVSGELQRYVDVASAVAAGISAQQQVTRQEFMEATAPLLRAELAGAAVVTFVSPVGDGEEQAAELRWRALGATELRLRPAPVREHLFIVHGRTLDGIPVPTGTDAGGQPQLVAALGESRRNGRVAVSDPYVLLSDRSVPMAQRQLSFVVAAPVDSPVTGVLSGWLVLALHARDMIGTTLQAPIGDRANAVLRVARRDGRTMPVAHRRVGPAAAGVPPRDVGVTITGRRWTLDITATEAAAAEDAQGGRFGLAVALGGLLATLLLSGVVWLLLGSRRRALRDVDVAEAVSRRRAELLRAVLFSISDGVGVIDGKGALLLHNPAAAQLFGPGLRPDRPDWWKAYRFLQADGRTPLTGDELPFARALRGEAVDHERLVVRRPEDGEEGGVTIQASVRALDPAAGTLGAVAVFRDVTDRHRIEGELRAAEERERFAFDHALTGMSVTDLAEGGTGRFLRVNRALCEMVGYAEDELLAMGFQDITHPDDLWRGRVATDEMRRGDRPSTLVEKRYVRKDGQVVHVEIQSTLVRDAGGRVLYGVAQTQDVTARRAEEDRLNEAARTDPLTGLGNRQFLQDRLALAVSRTARSQQLLGVVFCDLDGFKPVNDTYGHLAGDEVLRVVAVRLADSVRPADTVARLGGDEFVVICEDLAGPERAHQVADRIRQVIADPVRLPDGSDVRIGCSTGVVTASGPGLEVDDLLHRADLAMYGSKRGARSG